MMKYDKEEAKNLLVNKFDFRNILKNILNQDSLNSMKVIGFQNGLVMIPEKYNFLV